MKDKFGSLVNVLDKIIAEAPSRYKKRYSVTNEESLEQSRSKAFIHLFLMAKYGLLDFEKREVLVLDGSYDGGIDAYYIDKESKIINIIQSKFRRTKDNFESKSINIDELLSMDIKRITEGEEKDENGNDYNGKVLGFQRELSNVKNLGKYEYKVIILANTEYVKSSLEKLTGGFDAEVFDFNRSYSELVFPIVSGNYFNQQELEVSINLANTQHPRIQYQGHLGEQSANITVLFAPTKEIAKILHKYKNSILNFNPRSYLDMRKNSVNEEIIKTIKESDNNEFALFNNGITIVCGDCSFSEQTGKKNRASLTLNSPQIINGGQTAFTLSKVFEEHLDNEEELERVFKGKEVLVKIISFVVDNDDDDDDDDEIVFQGYLPEHLEVIEKVSQATNRQNPIDDADRKANDQIQVDFQKYAYEKYGIYYERKRGEFGDGITKKYIDRSYIVKRDDLMRCCLAADIKPGEARRANKKFLFSESVVDQYLMNKDSYDDYLVAFSTFEKLKSLEKEHRTTSDKYSVEKYGSAFRYGKFAVVSAVMVNIKDNEVEDKLDLQALNLVLENWKGFEQHARETNKAMFVNDENMLNYYKSSVVNADVYKYFSELNK